MKSQDRRHSESVFVVHWQYGYFWSPFTSRDLCPAWSIIRRHWSFRKKWSYQASSSPAPLWLQIGLWHFLKAWQLNRNLLMLPLPPWKEGSMIPHPEVWLLRNINYFTPSIPWLVLHLYNKCDIMVDVVYIALSPLLSIACTACHRSHITSIVKSSHF